MENIMWWTVYLFFINAAAVLVYRSDKLKAEKHLRRIPENTLLMYAVLGGGFGCLIGMYVFHHKTKHTKFTMGVPAIMLIEALCIGRIILSLQ